MARIRAVLRRAGGAAPAASACGSRTSRWTRRRTRSAAPGDRIELTPTEFKLLRYFLLNPRRVLSKAQILDHVWQYDFGGDANVVETYMSLPRQEGRRRRTAADPHRARRRLRAPPAEGVTMSLRARLLVVTVGLVAVGLLDRRRRRRIARCVVARSPARRTAAAARSRSRCWHVRQSGPGAALRGSAGNPGRTSARRRGPTPRCCDPAGTVVQDTFLDDHGGPPPSTPDPAHRIARLDGRRHRLDRVHRPRSSRRGRLPRRWPTAPCRAAARWSSRSRSPRCEATLRRLLRSSCW